MIEIRNLCYSYFGSDELQIANVCAKINSGETVGIVGKTGSGKSTLAKLISGIIIPSSGEVYLDGKNIKNIDNLYSKIGIVFQYPEQQLFSTSVYEDIVFGAKNKDKSKQEIDNIIEYLAEVFEIPKKVLNSSPFDISGGERRKCAIAGVLAMEPSVLVLDEPMAGLDSFLKEKLINYLKLYKAEKGITIIFVSHDMNDLVKISDRIIVMDGGKVKLFDEPRNIFSDKNKLGVFGVELPKIRNIFRILNSEKSYIKSDVLSLAEAIEELRRNIKSGE